MVSSIVSFVAFILTFHVLFRLIKRGRKKNRTNVEDASSMNRKKPDPRKESII
jgi:hypothetical protein